VARFDHVESAESEDGREGIEEFWQRAVEGRVEGLMFKVAVIYDDFGESSNDIDQLLETGLVMEVDASKKSGSRRKPLPATYEPGIPYIGCKERSIKLHQIKEPLPGLS
jgi:DNA ligase-1